ncbi:methyltransferase [Streptomyces coeruleoprunus]
MRLLSPHGVYAPQEDTVLLARSAAAELRCRGHRLPGAEVLDLGTGTGALALLAAREGAARVTAVDISWRAVLTARCNARRLGLRINVRHGDLTGPVDGHRFDLILSNPPYVRSPAPARGAARTVDAGPDGREVIDRLCADVPRLLRASGVLLLVQSALCGVGATLDRLQEGACASAWRTGQRSRSAPSCRGGPPGWRSWASSRPACAARNWW